MSFSLTVNIVQNAFNRLVGGKCWKLTWLNAWKNLNFNLKNYASCPILKRKGMNRPKITVTSGGFFGRRFRVNTHKSTSVKHRFKTEKYIWYLGKTSEIHAERIRDSLGKKTKPLGIYSKLPGIAYDFSQGNIPDSAGRKILETSLGNLTR